MVPAVLSAHRSPRYGKETLSSTIAIPQAHMVCYSPPPRQSSSLVLLYLADISLMMKAVLRGAGAVSASASPSTSVLRLGTVRAMLPALAVTFASLGVNKVRRSTALVLFFAWVWYVCHGVRSPAWSGMVRIFWQCIPVRNDDASVGLARLLCHDSGSPR